MIICSIYYFAFFVITYVKDLHCRDEELIKKACYWPHEIYDACYGGCAEITCDNPANHQRPCYPYCEPGCICADPYVRDDRTHQCVLTVDCTLTQVGIPIRKNNSDFTNQSSNRRTVQKLSNGKQPKRRGGGTDDEESNEESNEAENRGLKLDGPNANDFSRLGNYFNIVIAPPPIKTESRKIVSQKDSKKKKKSRSNR